MPYDPEHHHRRSIRLQGYDYTSAGAYFITMVVKERACVLGEIVDGEMQLTPIGEVVLEVWDSLPTRFPGVELDACVVMPNHIHAIVVITEEVTDVALATNLVADGDIVGAVHEPPLPSTPAAEPPKPLARCETSRQTQRRRMLLPKVIGYFKMNSAKRANLLLDTSGMTFWQRNYYEHIIRHDIELEQIRSYIAANPLRWGEDELGRGDS